MLRFLFTVCAGFTLLQAAEVQPLTVPTPGGPRMGLVALPKGGVRPQAPLVLLFHGHMGSAKNTLGQGLGTGSPLSAWLAIVDHEGVIAVALDGAKGADRKQGWNDGRPGSSGNPTTDDVGFATAVIDRMRQAHGIDPGRVYAMGMSNGGVFTFRLALESPRPLAAIAAICATMPGDRPPTATRSLPSALLVEGTADPLMPYEGGQVHFFSQVRGAVLGTEATLAFWRKGLGLTDPPRTEPLPHHGKEATRAVRMTWGDITGPQLRLVKVEGGGHCEPSPTHRLGWLYTQVCGVQSRDLETAEEAWAFFKDKRAARN